MAEWTVINIDKNKLGETLGATYAMAVPGGMVIRTFNQTGCGLVFIPMNTIMIAPGISNVDQWIKDNEVDK